VHLELQLVLQDIARCALSPRRIACELNDASRTQYRNNEGAAAAARANDDRLCCNALFLSEKLSLP
jgi:hypothetical protein